MAADSSWLELNGSSSSSKSSPYSRLNGDCGRDEKNGLAPPERDPASLSPSSLDAKAEEEAEQEAEEEAEQDAEEDVEEAAAEDEKAEEAAFSD